MIVVDKPLTSPFEEVSEAELRPFSDIGGLRNSIYDRVLGAFSSKFPIEDDYVRIEATNFRYNEKKKSYGPSAIKDAVMKGSKLSTPLYGDVRMIDKVTGDVLDEKKGHLMANVPHLTDRGTFINNGTEYVVSNQTRLKPGVYARVKENGEMEAHVNTRQGTGPSMRVFMEPETGVFRASVGDSKIKLYPILKDLGVSDDSLKAKWGEKIWEINSKAKDDAAPSRFFDKLVGTRLTRFRSRLEAAAVIDNAPEEDEVENSVEEIVTAKTAAAVVVPAHSNCFDVDKKVLNDQRRRVDQNPSEAKASSGNYRKGHIRFNGLSIAIEHPKGSIRSGTSPDGKKWSNEMHADYGYIKGSVGKDGDCLDVFIGPNLDSEVVFIIDQINKDGTFDEHKAVLGTKNRVEATDLYLSNYSKGWRCGPISSLTLDDFKAWVASGETGSMYSKQKKTAASAVDLLVQAKDASDRRDYGQKKNIMAALLREKPDEFFVDSEKEGIVGITHRPSGFQIHVTKDTVPHGISSQIPGDSTTKASDLVAVGGNQKQVLSTEMGRKVAEALRQISEVKPLPPIGGMMKGDAVASEKRSMVLEQLGRMEIDPEISMRNLGSEKANMDPDMLADIATKLLKINRGEASVDDRDDKANQTFHSPDDFFEERVLKDAGGVRRTLLFKSRYNGSLKGLKPGHFTGQLDGLVIGNSLSQAIGGINPVELFDSRFRVTQIGDGGIGSKDSIPLAARDVHPSQLGVIDVIRSPESGMVGIDQRLSGYARKGPNNQVYFPLIDRKTGKQVWRTPSQIHGKVVMFPRFRNQS